MSQGNQDIGFPLEVLNDRFPDHRVWSGVDHFLHRYEFEHIRKMQIASAVNRAHPSNPDDFLDGISINQNGAGLKLSFGALTGTKTTCDLLSIQLILAK